MRADRILLAYTGANFLFAGGGVLLLVGSILFSRIVNTTPTVENVPQVLMLQMVPNKVGLINAIIVFATFGLALPTIVMRDSRVWLKLQGWLTIVCGIFTLVIGVIIWFETLRTHAKLDTIWEQQTTAVQSLLQQRFDCCGFYNSTSPPFVTDADRKSVV